MLQIFYYNGSLSKLQVPVIPCFRIDSKILTGYNSYIDCMQPKNYMMLKTEV